MPNIDAGPHATPDQIRAAEKRAAAAAATRGESADAERTAPPKGRRATATSETSKA